MLYLPLTTFKRHITSLRFPVFVEDQVIEASHPMLVNIFNVSEFTSPFMSFHPLTTGAQLAMDQINVLSRSSRPLIDGACDNHDVSYFFFSPSRRSY